MAVQTSIHPVLAGISRAIHGAERLLPGLILVDLGCASQRRLEHPGRIGVYKFDSAAERLAHAIHVPSKVLKLYQRSFEFTRSPRHGRACCPGHPRLCFTEESKTWMPAT
jgi:hypothetical protein